MNLSSLERRIAVLERPTTDIHPFEIAISKLTDNELGLIEEYRSLCKAGFNVEQAREMMGDESYQMAVDAIQKVDQELKKLTMSPARQVVAKAKKRKTIDMEMESEPEIDYGCED